MAVWRRPLVWRRPVAHPTQAETDGGGGERGAGFRVVAVVSEGQVAPGGRQRREERHQVDVRRAVQHQVHLPCAFEDEVRVLKWLQQQQGKSYDRVGALTCWMPFSLRADNAVYPSYFCSQLMVCALCATSLLSPETQRTIQNRANVTPHRLHALLTDMRPPP